MTKDEFREQYALAKELVATWPAWKQNILEIYASPTVAVPRTPVDNDDLRTRNLCWLRVGNLDADLPEMRTR